MSYIRLSTRALVLFALSLGVTANPINVLDARAPADCSLVRCRENTTCAVLAGTAVCVPDAPQGEVCGHIVCAKGLTCCNASCGTCVKPGMMCTQQVCERSAEPAPAPAAAAPKGEVCGNTVCAEGLTCCNASCGMCVKPGMMCTQQICESPVVELPAPTPVTCGPTVCPLGQECCNSSCGYCVAPGKGCTKELCAAPSSSPLSTQVKCGKTLCAQGNVCCNSSCGICTPPGGVCTQQFCNLQE
ncbi:hypothetical protein QBC35DRAFT_434078 [Podospora australis]|uniref:Uncharacterized protein n=1 Tax=Podospora australis TaxID=1536484 RepID=A0AAN7AJJ3_9PEZI|nr:hypothetical protein QBC35DRAFT_434078 [Podospora australis]